MDFSALNGFEWDLGNVSKVQKRLDLAVVEFAFQGHPFVGEDIVHSDTEQRWFLVNRIQDRFVFVVFTVRKNRIRVISARFMRRREAKHYEAYFKADS